LVLGFTGFWVDNITAGRGFAAIALVRMGNWKPHWVYLATFLFGLLDALQFEFQVSAVNVPIQFLQMIPYAGAIGALVVISKWKRGGAPTALGVPYERSSS
jgi:simple sugar transport system permease protein